MTAADLCSSFKQWEVQRSNVSIIMEEFFQQVIHYLILFNALSVSLSLAIYSYFTRKQHLLTTNTYLNSHKHYHHQHIARGR
jgi:hypothetical protein